MIYILVFMLPYYIFNIVLNSFSKTTFQRTFAKLKIKFHFSKFNYQKRNIFKGNGFVRFKNCWALFRKK
jgi:hypothetical protein